VTLDLRVAIKKTFRKTGMWLLNTLNKLYSLTTQAANGVGGRGFVKKISENEDNIYEAFAGQHNIKNKVMSFCICLSVPTGLKALFVTNW
jgi:hypothetical protein